jgi:hypothetical protein
MTSVPMNPLKSANPAVGINRQTGSRFAHPAKSGVRSRARPPSP